MHEVFPGERHSYGCATARATAQGPRNLLHREHRSRPSGSACTSTSAEFVDMLSATSPSLLYVLGIPGGSLLVVVLICYGLYRVLDRFEH